jgi:hypothetical protein
MWGKKADDLAASKSDAGLPSVVAYQWVCESEHRGQEFAPGSAVPVGRKIKGESTKRKAYLASQNGLIYADFNGGFAGNDGTSLPEIWRPTSDVGMPEFIRYELTKGKQSVFQKVYIHTELSGGAFSGRFYGFGSGSDRSTQETFICKSNVWWPLAPSGW